MARAVIRVPRVDTNATSNGSAKQRSSLASPKALAREQQQQHVDPVDLPVEVVDRFEKQHERHHVPSNPNAQQSSGFNKVPSLMFDMEDTHDDKELQRLNGCYEDTMPSQAALDRLRSLVEAQDEDEEMLAMHVNYALSDALERRGDEMTTEELGERLRALGYTVTLRTALGGDSIGGNASCLRNLRHSFLAVCLPNATNNSSPDNSNNNANNADKVFIVDPKFLDQFEIAHSTSRYDAVLGVLPSAIVVPAGRLTDAVSDLCEEMARAFEKTGTPLPPWRQANAMLSKWQPRRSEDVAMTYQRRTPGSGGKTRSQHPDPMPTIVEKHYGPGAHSPTARSAQRAPAAKEGFGVGAVAGNVAAREGGGNLDHRSRRTSRQTSRQTTPDQVDLEAFYSSDDMAMDGKADGKTVWPGYLVRDTNNLVSEYVSLSI